MLDCVRSLAFLITVRGNYDDGERILHEVAPARSLSLGTKDPRVLADIHNLYCCLLSQGKCLECEARARQVLTARTQLQGSDHPDTLSQLPLIKFLLAQNCHAEGAEVLEVVAEKLSKVLGPEHTMFLDIQHELIRLLLGQKRYAEADIVGTNVLSLSAKHSSSNDRYVKNLVSFGRINVA